MPPRYGAGEAREWALEHLRGLYRQVAGEHPDWDDFDEAMRREERVAVRIHLDRAGPKVSG